VHLSRTNLQASKEAAAVLAAKRAEIAMAPEASFRLALNMELRDINHVPSDLFERKIQAFKRHLIQDIVNAIEGHKDHIRIEKIEPGSIMVTMAMETGVCGDQQTPIEAARSLKTQAADPKSKLMNGLYTRKTKSVSILSDAVEVTVDSCHEDKMLRVNPTSIPSTACSLPRSASGSGFSTPSTPTLQSDHQQEAADCDSIFKLPPQPADCDSIFKAADCDSIFKLPPQPIFMLPPQPEAPIKASHISAG
jgi:hypothetical protein